MAINVPTAEELKRWLTVSLEGTFGSTFDKFELLSRNDKVVDGSTVYMLHSTKGQFHAVVLCSPPTSPNLIQRAMDRSHQAKLMLGNTGRVPILETLSQGSVHGLSYAVLPYCTALSERRPVWWIQRALLSPLIFDWLWHATEATLRDVDPSAVDDSFAIPLKHLMSIKSLDSQMKSAALLAIERLASGAWVPRHVLMHGDLWKGNILIRPRNRASRRLKMSDRFVIIDWGGSEASGYAIFDLIRLARSMRLGKRKLQREVRRHCDLLRCEPADATSYLLTALGFFAMNLENFPMHRFLHMAESCYAVLAHNSD